MFKFRILVKTHVYFYSTNVFQQISKVSIRGLCVNRSRLKYVLPKWNSMCLENMSGKKGFKFSDYDCIGFDLDNTLTRYKISALLKLEYNALVKYLIERKGYPANHLSRPVEENLDFMMKGLVLDAKKGNVLHIDSNGLIVYGTHGTRELCKEDLVKYYGNDLKWELATSFTNDPLVTWNGELSQQMRSLLDYFDMPAGLAFARAVDSLDEKNGNQPLAEYSIYPHIIEALNDMFCREQFGKNEGGYFPYIKDDPESYYHKCSDKLINWLRELRKRNKILFLITGSNVDFASHTAENSIGPNWREFFDIIVFFAKKPGFFTQKRDFIAVEGLKETTPVKNEDLRLGGCYTHGNWLGLHEFLKKCSKKDDPKVVYIGDNLIQDVYTPSAHTHWDAVAISEELQAEGIHGVEKHVDKHYLTSELWGSYFHHPDEKSTFWKQIINQHAQICVPSLEFVANYPVDHEFSRVLG